MDWYTIPMLRLRKTARLLRSIWYRSFPLIHTLPPSGSSMPPSTWSRVDFPHPEGPRMAANCPLGIWKLVSFSA